MSFHGEFEIPEIKGQRYKNYRITKNMSFDEKVENLLNFGLRNRWYLIGPSAMVGSEPVSVTRLGERLVAWRNSQGDLHVLADYCPHRGAPLSEGHICDSAIVCRYHHVEVSSDGTVTRVPGDPSARMVGRKLVKSYPVIEHFQAIFVYFGDERHPKPPPLNLPEELLSSQWTGFPSSVTFKCNYRYSLDNLIDIMHPQFLHSQSYMVTDGQQVDEVQLEQRQNGLVVRRKFDPTSVGEMEVVDNGFRYERISISVPPVFGPADYPLLRIFALATPIDDEHCQYHVWRLRKAAGWQGALYRFMFNTVHEQRTWDLTEQDRTMLEAMPPSFPPQETLYQHDIGVIALRRFLKNQAEAQIRELEANEVTA